MKHLFFFMLSFIAITGVSAQVINVPDKAQKHFEEKYAGAANVKWSNNVANYDANFKMDGVSFKAHYNIDGTWDYTEKFLKKDDAPQIVKDSYSKSSYRDNAVKSLAYVENNKGEKLYRYEVKTGVTRTYVFFDEEGKLIKTNATV